MKLPPVVVLKPYVIRITGANFRVPHQLEVAVDESSGCRGRCTFEAPPEPDIWRRDAHLQDILAPQKFITAEWIPDTDCFLEIE